MRPPDFPAMSPTGARTHTAAQPVWTRDTMLSIARSPIAPGMREEEACLRNGHRILTGRRVGGGAEPPGVRAGCRLDAAKKGGKRMHRTGSPVPSHAI